ncbi:MAG: glycosyltransferase family 2 protein [Candidatus Aureabacteria bacterium]|nr:glycosyltransferase family 2 protein [Candidatus Auribacterota bacterium]
MLSLIIPAFNEENMVAGTITAARDALTSAGIAHEIIVVDDGSTDGTAEAAKAAGAKVIAHSHNIGYGAALKTGIVHAQFDWIAIIDADSKYPPGELPSLLTHIPRFDMVVGARTGKDDWATFPKRCVRRLFLWVGEVVTKTYIPDVSSGMQVFRKTIALRHLGRLGNGYSFTTTLTLAVILGGGFITYIPIAYHPRVGDSHLRYFRDLLRVGQILIQTMIYASPLKIFSMIGIGCISIAFIAYAAARLFPRYTFTPPLLGLALLITGFQSLFFGIIADLILREK